MSKSRIDTPIGVRMSQSWNDFVNKYDLGSLPAFGIFFVVVTLGMILNFLAMRRAIGDLSAGLVSCLFEFGILGWKWTSNRKQNNDTQAQIIEVATWISVGLAVAMLVINLFRTTIEKAITADVGSGATMNGWEVTAYIVIGLAALVHIVAYLLFDSNDADKQYKRENKRKDNDIRQRGQRADDTIRQTESDLRIIQKITVELNRLRELYSTLPNDQLEIVLENSRVELLDQYQASELVKKATAALPDLNKDNMIGSVPIPPAQPQPAFTPSPAMSNQPSAGARTFNLDDLLEYFGVDSAERALVMLQQMNIQNAAQAYTALKSYLPADLDYTTFALLFNQLLQKATGVPTYHPHVTVPSPSPLQPVGANNNNGDHPEPPPSFP